MKNNVTELVFILDMSGSMERLTDDTIGGFNSVLKEHRNGDGEVLVTTCLFNNDSVIIHDRVNISDVPEMTEKEYRASGCTALVDAMGSMIDHIASIHRYAREEDVPGSTIFVITTDGMENASHKYDVSSLREKIKHEQEKYGWEFIFMAENIDAVATAREYGIREEYAVDCHHDAAGTAAKYRAASRAIRNSRDGIKNCETVEWRAEADKDFQKRSR